MVDLLFYHADMELATHSTSVLTTIKSPSDYYQRKRRNAMDDQINAIQTSYLKYVNKLDYSSGLLFPCRILKSGSKSNLGNDRTVLFATTKKLGEGVDVKTLHTVCLTVSLVASNLPQLEQIIGRLRKSNRSLQIYEFMDRHPDLARQCTARQRKFYSEREMKQIFL